MVKLPAVTRTHRCFSNQVLCVLPRGSEAFWNKARRKLFSSLVRNIEDDVKEPKMHKPRASAMTQPLTDSSRRKPAVIEASWIHILRQGPSSLYSIAIRIARLACSNLNLRSKVATASPLQIQLKSQEVTLL
jgi:hypothetical protein